MGPLRMVPMASLPPFRARLAAAQLGAEGIVWQLRGESSVYPFAPVELLVEEDELERARDLLDANDATDANDANDATDSGRGERDGWVTPGTAHRAWARRALGIWVWLVIAAVLAGLALRISQHG